MLNRLFPRRPVAKALPQPDSQLALGALLVRIALADSDYKQAEVAAIDRILAASFGLGPLEAAKLRSTCTDLEMHGTDRDEFTRILREEVAYADRRAMAHAMWQVVLADGERDDLEETVLHEIEAALGITPEDSTAARNAALGSRDAAGGG
jgi:uncharacterized tellurite resistance protein B-like protein